MAGLHPTKFIRVAFLFIGIALGLGLLAVFLNLPVKVERGIHLGTALAALNGILSYATLRWAFDRPAKFFYGAFVGGIFWRLLLLGAASFFTLTHGGFDFLSTLLSLIFVSTFFLLLELEYLPKSVPA